MATRKRVHPVKRWLRRNSFIIFLCVFFLIAFFLGMGVRALFIPSEEDNKETSVAIMDDLSFTRKPDAEIVFLSSPAPTDSVEETEEPVFYFDIPLDEEMQDYIRSLSVEYEVPMELIIGMIDVESSFRTDVVSETFDYGLMQINSINHEWLSDELGITDILDPKQNVLCGIYIISGHLKATNGDVTKALMRYNNGPTGARRLWEQGIYSTSYTDKINTAYEFYKEESRHDG